MPGKSQGKRNMQSLPAAARVTMGTSTRLQRICRSMKPSQAAGFISVCFRAATVLQAGTAIAELILLLVPGKIRQSRSKRNTLAHIIYPKILLSAIAMPKGALRMAGRVAAAKVMIFISLSLCSSVRMMSSIAKDANSYIQDLSVRFFFQI